MRNISRIIAFGLLIAIGGLVSDAHAQYKGKSRPFDSSARRPSVSPYMNLINNNTGQATNYQSLVRPQIDQQNYNTQAASAIKNLQRQQAASSMRSKSSSEGNTKMRATGHAATRETYSHFYPSLGH